MKKRLTEQLAILARNEGKKPQQGAECLAAVLSLREEILEAINDGWTKKAIWLGLQHRKAFPGSYQAFIRAWERATESRSARIQEQQANVAIATNQPEPVNNDSKNGPRIISTENKTFSFNNIKKR